MVVLVQRLPIALFSDDRALFISAAAVATVSRSPEEFPEATPDSNVKPRGGPASALLFPLNVDLGAVDRVLSPL